MVDMVLDVQGMNCPMPILKAKKALDSVPPGGLLKILATDPGSVEDFNSFCRTTGHELMESGEEDGVYTYVIKRMD